MAKLSGGLLMYRTAANDGIEVFLAHPGGPYFHNKDKGVWSIPKGELEGDENHLSAAIREFEEEIGFRPDPGLNYHYLGEAKQKGGKINHIWAFESNPSLDGLPQSNTFPMEWPPKSGKTQYFPEVDHIGFFDIPTAKEKIRDRQAVFLDRLLLELGYS
jgi:predicted NUDIX family NTP pyrophosphohydrolase